MNELVLKEMLEAFAKFQQSANIKTMYQFLLEHGKPYVFQPLPKNIKPMTPKMCFWNAGTLAMKRKLVYVEGVAISESVPIMLHHAWCSKPGTNIAIEPTWAYKTEPIYYFGVAFNKEALKKQRRKKCISFLDDYTNHWEILRMDNNQVKELLVA